MENPMRRLTLLFLTALLASPAAAMQMEATRPELCTAADSVVIAEVTSFEVLWVEGDNGGILTRVWLAPLMTLRGETPDTIELLLPGGELVGVKYEVEDTPVRPELDKRYLLFLDVRSDGSSRVVGGEAGAVRIADIGEVRGERYIEAVASVGSLCDAR
jgi:hypothetical protein